MNDATAAKTKRKIPSHKPLCGAVSGQILVCLVLNGRKLPHIPELIEKLKKIPGFATSYRDKWYGDP